MQIEGSLKEVTKQSWPPISEMYRVRVVLLGAELDFKLPQMSRQSMCTSISIINSNKYINTTFLWMRAKSKNSFSTLTVVVFLLLPPPRPLISLNKKYKCANNAKGSPIIPYHWSGKLKIMKMPSPLIGDLWIHSYQELGKITNQLPRYLPCPSACSNHLLPILRVVYLMPPASCKGAFRRWSIAAAFMVFNFAVPAAGSAARSGRPAAAPGERTRLFVAEDHDGSTFQTCRCDFPGVTMATADTTQREMMQELIELPRSCSASPADISGREMLSQQHQLHISVFRCGTINNIYSVYLCNQLSFKSHFLLYTCADVCGNVYSLIFYYFSIC